jgi:hypothetical protein
MTVGPDAPGSFLTMMGFVCVPLQSRIIKGPRVPEAKVTVSPGLTEEQANIPVFAEILWSAASADSVPPR